MEGEAPTNHYSSQKTRLNDLSYGIKIWTDLSSVLSQCTCLTDRRTDRQSQLIVIARPRLHSMQHGKKLLCGFAYMFVGTKHKHSLLGTWGYAPKMQDGVPTIVFLPKMCCASVKQSNY